MFVLLFHVCFAVDQDRDVCERYPQAEHGRGGDITG